MLWLRSQSRRRVLDDVSGVLVIALVCCQGERIDSSSSAFVTFFLPPTSPSVWNTTEPTRRILLDSETHRAAAATLSVLRGRFRPCVRLLFFFASSPEVCNNARLSKTRVSNFMSGRSCCWDR